MEIKEISIQSPAYPDLLRQIKSPPKTLYCRGRIEICSGRCLAVVGSRKATPYGRWAAYQIAKRAAEHGITIVSGMATGIDTEAHRGALEAGGKTVAVLACGPDLCYPSGNRQLMARILETGAVLSEYPPGAPPLAGQFPVRNRIISGLSEAVVVAEAGLKSGSLITAGWALEQNKDVYAVPGAINNIYSLGANKLIQDGATPIVVVDDILTLMGISKEKGDKIEESKFGKDEKVILDLVKGQGETTLDQICLKSGKSPGEVAALISILEIKGAVVTSIGKIFLAY